MNPGPDTLQAELRARALWHDAGTAARTDRSAWYVRVLLGAAAWLAACLFLPLIGVLLADVIDLTPWTGFVAAAACCAMAVPLLRAGRGDFLRQLGSAVSLAGLILAFSQALSFDGPGWIGLGILAGAMYGVAPRRTPGDRRHRGLVFRDPVFRDPVRRDPVHRFLCASMGAVALVLAIDRPAEFDLSGLSMAVLSVVALVIWAAQLPVAAHPRWQALEPMAWAFFLIGAVLGLIASGPWIQGGVHAPATFRQAVPTGLCALAPAVVWWLASRQAAGHGIRPWRLQRVLGGLVLLALAPVWMAVPGAALALCAILLGYALFRTLLLGAGAAALLAHLAAYYYQAHTTLLQKSFSLFVAGAALVCVALLAGVWQRRSQ
jgi:hypothetical protein